MSQSDFVREMRTIESNVVDILEASPESRDSIKSLIMSYWVCFDRFYPLADNFTDWWFNHATSPETLRRTWQKVLKDNLRLRGPLYNKRHHISAEVRKEIVTTNFSQDKLPL